jgi:hypothetical protein
MLSLWMKRGDHVAAIQTEGAMNERELAATVRQYFGAGVPRVPAPRSP